MFSVRILHILLTNGPLTEQWEILLTPVIANVFSQGTKHVNITTIVRTLERL